MHKQDGIGRRVCVALVLVAIGLVIPAVSPPGAGADGNEAPGAPLAFRSISLGNADTCVVLDDGSVRCWGLGGNGRIGSGSTTTLGDGPGEMGDNLQPVDLGTGRTATTVAAGLTNTCALLDDAQVKCWGYNFFGQLGLGDTTARGDGPGEMGDALPAVDLGTGRTATAITAGAFHTCALLDDGTVKCWGRGLNGVLGTGATDDRGDSPGEMGDNLLPVPLGTGRTAIAITAGTFHTCALLDDLSVKCWGAGANGELGQGKTEDRGDDPGEMGDNLIGPTFGTGRTAVAISAGESFTCALLDNVSAKCWGYGANGRLGSGATANVGDSTGEMGDALPAVALGTGRTALAVTAAGGHACVVLDDHTVKCWGANSSGELGAGDVDDRGDAPGEMGNTLATVALGTGRTTIAVSAGESHTSAVLDTGRVKCWGAGSFLGYGTNTPRGDEPGEMGDALPNVDLDGHLVGRVARVAVTVTADQSRVVAGQDIDYHVTVSNPGDVALTAVQLTTPDVPDCAGPVRNLTPGASQVVDCSYATTSEDVPMMTNQALVTTAQGAVALSGTRRTRVDEPSYRADARIRVGAGAPVGDNLYNTTAAGQARSATVGNLGTATFTVTVQNDGNAMGDYTVAGLGSTTRYTVTYKDGATNITNQVVAGTYTVSGIAPGATHDLTVTIKAKAGTPVGNALSRVVTITSSDDDSQDAVKATVTRH